MSRRSTVVARIFAGKCIVKGVFVIKQNILPTKIVRPYRLRTPLLGVATNNGLGDEGDRLKWDLFCSVSTNVVKKSLMFLHHVNNIERNIKHIYTRMGVISLIPT